MNEPDQESPESQTVAHADKFSEQFAGLVNNHEAAPKARSSNHIGGQSVHEWRTSPGSTNGQQTRGSYG
jgi:hypothetical protein